jgi:hypothetical protein
MALAIDGADVDVGGVLILHNGKIHGGDSFVFTSEATSVRTASGGEQ